MLYKELMKKDLFNLDTNVKDDLDYLTNLFNFYNLEIYLVGGCVRDLILKRTPSDFDLCTNATPQMMKKMFNSTSSFTTWLIHDTGISHGTVTAYNYANGTYYEITTYRTEGKYSDNRRPDSVEFITSLEEDLKRRDFTINSLAYDFFSEELIMLDKSYLLDIDYKVIKCVGDPNERFKEDALRMMRAIRFSAQLNASITIETFNAIKCNAHLILNVSTERVRDELTKIIMSDHPENLKLLIFSQLTKYVFQEIENISYASQKNDYHHTDVFHHTIEVMKAVPKDDLVLRLAALYHDIGKLYTGHFGENGQEHHYGHERESAIFANKRLRELKFDNDTIDNVVRLIAIHGYHLEEITKMSFLKRLVNKVGEDLFQQYLVLRHADAIAHSVQVSGLLVSYVAKTKELYQELLLTQQPLSLKDLAINGYDVMASLDVFGKDVGDALNYCLEHVIEYPEDNTTEKLLKLLKKFIKRRK